MRRNRNNIGFVLSLMLLTFLFPASSSYAATMTDYCITPPFVVAGVKPNLLMMLDNSGSQYDLEYIDTSSTATFCYDNTYKKSNVCSTTSTTLCTTDANCPPGETCISQYPGYFDPNKFYTSTGVPYATDITTGNTTFSLFTEAASLPGSCTYKTDYLCINLTASSQTITIPGTCKKTPPQGTCTYANCSCYSNADCGGSGNSCQGTSTTTTTVYDVSNFTASGKFLNWLAMSKMDIQKGILTGGKYDTANQVLISEGRGCVGSRYVKEVPLADWNPAQATTPVSFGVRGDVSTDIRMPSTGGITRIDIFRGDFNNSSCAAAVNCWATCGNNCGTCKNSTDTCLSLSNTGGDSATWNHALQSCWTCAHQPCCPEDMTLPGSGMGGGNDYTRIWTTNECGDTTYDYTGLASNQPRYICLKDTAAASPDATTFTGCSMNNYAGDVGLAGKYLGVCSSLADGTAKEKCTQYQFAYFCRGMQVGEVVDPSSGTTDTSTRGNIPANLIDGGIAASLGKPIRTLHVRVSQSTAPTGLIQQFQDQIRFGAMDFNTYGSKVECSNPDSRIIYTCSYAANKDAGQILPSGKCSTTTSRQCGVDADCPSGETCVFSSYKYAGYVGAGKCEIAGTDCAVKSDCPGTEKCVPNVGDHTRGLISMIDGIRAATWTPFSEAFYTAINYFSNASNTELANLNTSADFDASKNPIEYRCQKNNVLLITDGMSTADLNSTVSGLVNNNVCGGSCNFTTTSSFQPQYATSQIDIGINSFIDYAGSRNLADLAYIAQHRDITKFSDIPDRDSHKITTHVVYSGIDAGHCSTTVRKCTASSGCPAGETCILNDETNPKVLMKDTAINGGGTFANPQNPKQLQDNLRATFQSIAVGASSGSAASVLASGEGSGANLIQALFYPKRTITSGSLSTTLSWTGSLQNYWYYVDPLLKNSTIREDTDRDKMLEVAGDDYIIHFFSKFCSLSTDTPCSSDSNCPSGETCLVGTTRGFTYRDSDGNGIADNIASPNAKKYLDDTVAAADRINYLWESGRMLFERPASDRKIFTTTGGTTRISFDTSNSGSLQTLLQAGNSDEAKAIIDYVRGIDVKVCSASKKDCTTSTAACTALETCDAYRNRTATIDGTSNVWKLGDIVSSTPKIASWIPINTYHKVYRDSTYGPIFEDPKLEDPVDNNHFSTKDDYKNRGLVFVGANDGMLHAFKLGTIKLFDEKSKKAQLCASRTNCSSLGDLGKEVWAYIPMNALPYLKYMTDPTNYCHLNYVDLTPSIFDVSIGGATRTASTWKTILIGGMRLGGACKTAASAHGVTTPDPANPNNGFSSYFALDITDTVAHSDDPVGYPPKVLWEFSDPGLGFATSGPAVVRVGPASGNGSWFVVFGSGPTGPIDTATHQFMGHSDQNLKLFIFDLWNGPSAGVTPKEPNPAIPNAFTGSLSKAPIDLDQNNASNAGFYQDDALYFGYVQAESANLNTAQWNKGGVLRLVTKESITPGSWEVSHVIDNIGPVTAGVAKLQNYKPGSEALWLYFGTGRYYYKIGSNIDDPTNPRWIYGLKEPCFNDDPGHYPNKLNPSCTTTLSETDLGDVTTTSAAATSDGWRILLNAPDPTYMAERVTTDPAATTVGAVLFTTIKPASEVCEYGGVTHVWGVKYNTGGALPSGLLKGTALIQVSTGSIEEKGLSDLFKRGSDTNPESPGERQSDAIQGISSPEPPQVPVAPKPLNRILHIRER